MRHLAGFLAILWLGACSVEHADAPPGRNVVVVEHVGAEIFGEGFSRAYERIRLIAPPGSSRCGLVPFAQRGGPQRRGVPDAEDSVYVTVSAAQSPHMRVYCDTPGGHVERAFDRIEIWRGPSSRRPIGHVYMYPPLIHLGGRDAQADERWRQWAIDVCTGHSVPMCTPENIAAFRAADLGAEVH